MMKNGILIDSAQPNPKHSNQMQFNCSTNTNTTNPTKPKVRIMFGGGHNNLNLLIQDPRYEGLKMFFHFFHIISFLIKFPIGLECMLGFGEYDDCLSAIGWHRICSGRTGSFSTPTEHCTLSTVHMCYLLPLIVVVLVCMW